MAASSQRGKGKGPTNETKFETKRKDTTRKRKDS